ncbi:MAG: amidohydrolase family protein [Bryobacteraceae bacterium]
MPIRLVLALAFFTAMSLHAADRALVGGAVYPSPDAPPIANAVVIIHDGRIAAVGPRESVRVPKNVTTLDCSGKFITAGFWNSHVHIITPGLLHVRDTAVADLNEQLDAMLNRWGFTSVFDIASVLENTVELRRRIDRSGSSGSTKW